MVPAFLCLVTAPYTIQRDAYGVPKVLATSVEAAYEGNGYATAQDRLWQLEMNRRVAEGRLAEVLGPSFVSSDKEVLQLGYTHSEIDAQVASLKPGSRSALAAYARGVNRAISEATASNSLPPGYASNGFKPKPWKPYDSAAIAIYTLRLFGRGGAGEIRNLALLQLLAGRPNLKGKLWDVVDDIAWLQDPKAVCTVSAVDDPVKHRPVFSRPTQDGSIAQLAALPKTSLFELLPGIRISERPISRAVAMDLAAPFETGSYCMVVGRNRSKTQKPLLLSGPQMGHTSPAVIHEIALRAPGLNVTGIDVPGTPGVVIGATPAFAWGLTSGVADVEDVFAFHGAGADAYTYGGKTLPYTEVRLEVPVKGGPTQTIVQRRTIFGPVVILTSGGAFALRSAFRNRELSCIDAFFGLPALKTPASIDGLMSTTSMSFNFFYATSSGHIGYRYCGRVPLRNPAIDPRLPTPATPANDWRGFVPATSMPHVLDPGSGLLVNWNNKPVGWWPNGDTPVWGEVFRNSEILAALGSGKLDSTDLARAVKTIAMRDSDWRFFRPLLGKSFGSWDGTLTSGSKQPNEWFALERNLRRELFSSAIGNLGSAANFDQAVQATLILHALEGKTKYDYLAGRSRESVTRAALAKVGDVDAYRPGGFQVPGEEPVPYSNRGSYIQLLECKGTRWTMQAILPPGEAESGPHFLDQVPLARRFAFIRSWQP